ncbi:MAG: protein translocase subunit SecF [Treponema sp.]|nr:protein translocase subunit SecF [Treponema sp.]MCL2271903.1 protein translocase subunit SecF [Treponema sp.]
MKKVIQFSKFFIPAAIISLVIIIFGVTGFLTRGFTLGVDFQAGLIQEVQIVPTAFSLRWSGTSNAILSFDRNGLYIVISGVAIENRTYSFLFNDYSNVGSLTRAMKQELNELEVTVSGTDGINAQWLIFSSQGNPNLNNENPYVVHYLDPYSPPVDISEIRVAMAGYTQGVSVQNMGARQQRQFMIRVEDRSGGYVQSSQIISILESYFGKGNVAVLRSDYVDSRFSKDLTDQAGMLLGLTLLIIFIYMSFRFKPQFALGSIIGIINDGIVIVAFVVWSRMEFTTSTIAAILTLLGYSLNNTIILFDRIRENRRIFPDNAFIDVLNISLTNVLGRTIITTVSTMLAVLFLFIFTKGSMSDFALALMIGMVSGFYTTLFITSGFVNFYENLKIKREKKKALKV